MSKSNKIIIVVSFFIFLALQLLLFTHLLASLGQYKNRFAFEFFLGEIIIFFLLALFLLAIFRKNYILPLKKITSLLDEFVEKIDFTKRMPTFGDKRLKELTIKLNKFLEKLHSTIAQVKSTEWIASDLISASHPLSEEIISVGSQAAESVEVLTQSVEEQVRSVQNTLGMIEAIAVSSEYITQQAQNTEKLSIEAQNSIEKSRNIVENAFERIEEVNRITHNITNSVENLAKKMENVLEVTNMLAHIADQTNLLALNAAIEAARAGEAGKGFAVVAEEIRKLADESNSFAERIGSLIREIRRREDKEAIKTQRKETLISTIKKGMEEIRKEMEMFYNVKNTLSQVFISLKKTYEAAISISETTISVVTGLNTIRESLEKTGGLSKEAARASQLVNNSVQQQVTAMEKLRSNLSQLSFTYHFLEKLLEKFKI